MLCRKSCCCIGLQTSTVLQDAIRAGLALLTWQQDAFAYAEGYDESAERYRGLRSAVQITVTADDAGLLVRPEVARRQIDQETAPPVPVGGDVGDGKSQGTGPTAPGLPPAAPAQQTNIRFISMKKPANTS